MNTLQNKLWPNTDGNLGKIKVQIPAGTVDDPWPEGDAFVENFVYKNGKLVGFIDTAALIPNESGETIIPYDTINTKFPGILKDTFIINAGERCKYQLAKLEEDIAAYTSTRLFEIMDADKFKVSYDKSENKVTVTVSLDTTEAQIADIQNMLDRVLPSNVVAEMQWPDGLPTSYRKLEYLEGTGKQFINTGVRGTGALKIDLEVEATAWDGFVNYIFGTEGRLDGNPGLVFSMNYNGGYGTVGAYFYGTQSAYGGRQHALNTRYKYVFDENVVYRNGVLFPWRGGGAFDKEEFITTRDILLFGSYHDNGTLQITSGKQVFAFSIFDNAADEPVLNYIPALDNTTGQPGMYDTVNRVFKTNVGRGDFTYPGKETEVATYSLRNSMYGKITEHGIRRLYRVPEGYSSKEEYAVENGFKPIVEPPMPEDGNWAPVWHETETQLILDWVETEAPTEITE